MFEKVYMVWDIYDGARTGLSNYKSSPHYFSCVIEDYLSDKFELYPIRKEFLIMATEQWEIFQHWELRFHSGIENLKNHPGRGGVNRRYDELEISLKREIPNLIKLDSLFIPEFRVVPGQEDLPTGVLREIEVEWCVFT